ncbi:transposase domain-containing protein [Chelativorans salis]|uniref:transposase domain-containing protein n=1 Tax=Chelativorans salis TaxID=2978478 RepID=UPI003CC640A5
MTRYLDDGHLAIENNPAERALRKNCLFAGSDDRGERATLIYSLIDTAILSGLSPPAYLADVLVRIVGYSAKRVDELPPLIW